MKQINEEFHLSARLEELGLHADAIAWLMDVYKTIQLLDDAHDGDPVQGSAEDVASAVFVRMPTNPFFIDKAGVLIPVLALQLTKWGAANDAETQGKADERSFVWRAGFYDLVATCCILCGLPASGRLALGLYGESFADYREEFPCQRQQ
jgi:hypothetical protein